MAIAVISDPDLKASFEGDGDVLLMDSRTGAEIGVRGSGRWMASDLCTVTVGGEALLAGGCSDGTIQLREPLTGKQVRVLNGHREPVSAVCELEAGGLSLLASASWGDRTIRLWDPVSGEHIRTLRDDEHRPGELCKVTVDSACTLASSDNRKIWLWDPSNGRKIRILEGHSAGIMALCTVEDDGVSLIASGESTVDQVEINRGEVGEDELDHTVRLWNPVSGEQIRTLEGHSGDVTAVCSISIRNRNLLASASRDGTVRIWNPARGVFGMNIPINYSATSMTWMNDSLFIGLDGGVIAIKFDSIQWPDLAVCAVSAVLVIDISCLNLESGTPLSATAQCNHSRNAPNQGL